MSWAETRVETEDEEGNLGPRELGRLDEAYRNMKTSKIEFGVCPLRISGAE